MEAQWYPLVDDNVVEEGMCGVVGISAVAPVALAPVFLTIVVAFAVIVVTMLYRAWCGCTY